MDLDRAKLKLLGDSRVRAARIAAILADLKVMQSGLIESAADPGYGYGDKGGGAGAKPKAATPPKATPKPKMPAPKGA